MRHARADLPFLAHYAVPCKAAPLLGSRVCVLASKASPVGVNVGVALLACLPALRVLLSSDSRSGIVDALSTMVIDETQLKLYVWYDNEYGYCARMVDVATMVARSLSK